MPSFTRSPSHLSFNRTPSPSHNSFSDLEDEVGGSPRLSRVVKLPQLGNAQAGQPTPPRVSRLKSWHFLRNTRTTTGRDHRENLRSQESTERGETPSAGSPRESRSHRLSLSSSRAGAVAGRTGGNRGLAYPAYPINTPSPDSGAPGMGSFQPQTRAIHSPGNTQHHPSKPRVSNPVAGRLSSNLAPPDHSHSPQPSPALGRRDMALNTRKDASLSNIQMNHILSVAARSWDPEKFKTSCHDTGAEAPAPALWQQLDKHLEMKGTEETKPSVSRSVSPSVRGVRGEKGGGRDSVSRLVQSFRGVRENKANVKAMRTMGMSHEQHGRMQALKRLGGTEFEYENGAKLPKRSMTLSDRGLKLFLELS